MPLSICRVMVPALLAVQGLAAQSPDGLFPVIDGWKRSDSIRVFTPQTLYSYIDGAADAYLMQDFVRLSVAYYTRGGDTSVTVEIYNHRTEQHAYGIYSQERTSSVEYLPIGIQGYYAETILNFVIGTTYVKLTSYSLGNDEREYLRAIAEALAGKVGGTTAPPPLFQCFPEKGAVPNSWHFTGKDFLGYPCFQSVYSTDYQADSLTFQLFIIPFPDPDALRSAWKEYLKSAGRSPDLPASGTNTIDDPYQGTITFDLRENILCGIIGRIPAEKSRYFLSALHTCLHASKQ